VSATPILYTSEDAGQPFTAATDASLLALIKGILVTGYGSKPGAGWELIDESGSFLLLRIGGTQANRPYVRFHASYAISSQYWGLRVRMFETATSLSDVDGPLPTFGQYPSTHDPHLPITSSSTSTRYLRPWVAMATRVSFNISFHNGTSNSSELPTVFSGATNAVGPSIYVGRFISNVPGDIYNWCLLGGNAVNSTPSAAALGSNNVVGTSGVQHSHVLMRDRFGNVPILCAKGFLYGNGLSGRVGGLFPDANSGNLHLQQKYFLIEQGLYGSFIRGHLPGIHPILGTVPYEIYRNQFEGTGELEGKTFQLFPWTFSGTDPSAIVAVDMGFALD
jgi:hypothetical protein